MIKISSDIQFLLHPLTAPPPADWHQFEKLIYHHRFHHILEDVYSKYSSTIPPEVKERLKNNYRNRLHDQLVIAKEMQDLASKFNSAGLEYYTFKGTALAIQFYGDISGRLTRDLDFYIQDKDIEDFLEIFSDSGYLIAGKEQNQPVKYFRKVKKNQTLVNAGKNIITELHWSLFSNTRFYSYEKELFLDPELVQVGNLNIPTMNKMNHFYYLCMHGIYHEYFRLFWLRDIMKAFEIPEIDFEKLIFRANNEGMTRIVYASIILAEECYQISSGIPGIKADKKTMQIVNHCIRVINRSSIPGSADRIRRIRYFADLKKDPAYKMECVSGVVKRYFVR